MIRFLALPFVALAALATVRGTTPDGANQIGAAPILLGLDSVRAELKLDSLQRAVLSSLRNEYRSAAGRLVDPMPATPEARAAAEKKWIAVTEDYNRRALGALNPSQRKRFAEIETQVIGATLLYAPAVQQKLTLTPAQVKKIDAIRGKGVAYVGKVNRRYTEGKISHQERIALLRDRRLSQGEALLEVLTPSQRAAFQAMGGEKFSFRS